MQSTVNCKVKKDRPNLLKTTKIICLFSIFIEFSCSRLEDDFTVLNVCSGNLILSLSLAFLWREIVKDRKKLCPAATCFSVLLDRKKRARGSFQKLGMFTHC